MMGGKTLLHGVPITACGFPQEIWSLFTLLCGTRLLLASACIRFFLVSPTNVRYAERWKMSITAPRRAPGPCVACACVEQHLPSGSVSNWQGAYEQVVH